MSRRLTAEDDKANTALFMFPHGITTEAKFGVSAGLPWAPSPFRRAHDGNPTKPKTSIRPN